jgi:hypothetical protein
MPAARAIAVVRVQRTGAGQAAGPRLAIDCLKAILRERTLNSRTAKRPPPKAVRIRASLTSKSFRASLRQANNDEIQFRAVSFVPNQPPKLELGRFLL